MAGWYGGVPPREKLMMCGPASLTDAELLAIFLRTGLPGLHVIQMAEDLIDEFGSLYNLMSADYVTFCAKKGLGDSKYTQLQAVSEIVTRSFYKHLSEKNAMLSPEVTQRYLQNILSHREREIFLVMFLDNQYHVIHSEEMFMGTIDSVEIHPREIVRKALTVNAAALILAHNHPSGKAEPSRCDRLITTQVIRACRLLGICVLDHLVIGHGECVSFAERGWI